MKEVKSREENCERKDWRREGNERGEKLKKDI